MAPEVFGGGVVGLAAGEHLGDPAVVDQVGEAVAAHHEPVARGGLEPGDVHAAALRVTVDRAEDHVAPRVGAAGLGAQLTGVDQVLDVGVVAADLAQHAVAQEVGARVPDVA